MSNRELYKQTFSHLHTDHTLDPEGVKMKMHRKEQLLQKLMRTNMKKHLIVIQNFKMIRHDGANLIHLFLL